jgi:hypothetical protein
MFTDAPPRRGGKLAQFGESDRTVTLTLPEKSALEPLAHFIELAMNNNDKAQAHAACMKLLESLSQFYEVPICPIRVLAARPLHVRENWSSELFGDYDPSTMAIRVWMRTAIKKNVTSFGTFLSTLLHEYCHHLDFHLFHFPDSWHTRGFYERAAALYHHARGTPRKKLFWTPASRERWRIDWPRTNRGQIEDW